MLVTIKSDNLERLSYCLSKNPASGMQFTKAREGKVAGWFSPEGYYHLWLREGVGTNSFTRKEFDHISFKAVTCPMAANIAISQGVRGIMNPTAKDHLELHRFEVVLEQVQLSMFRTFEHFKQHFGKTWDINLTPLNERQRIYKVSISPAEGKCSLPHILQFVCLMTMVLSSKEELNLDKVSEEFIERYMRYCNTHDAPYFIRYVLVRNLFDYPDQFERRRHLIDVPEKNFSEEDEGKFMTFQFGDTSRQRLEAIKAMLDFIDPIVDIGCGEGKVMDGILRHKKQLEEYHAIDIDENCILETRKKAKSHVMKRKHPAMIDTYGCLQDYIVQRNAGQKYCEILCTEVIEHMPVDHAEELIRTSLTQLRWTKAVFTTPDADFNKHYLLKEGEFRHDDHDWEMNRSQFEDWFKGILVKYGIEADAEWVGIGDCVDGVYTSQAFVLKNRSLSKRAIVTIGAPASGKSFWAENFVDCHEWREINRDRVRFGAGKPKDWTQYDFTPKNENIVTKRCDAALAKANRLGRNVIITDTNLNDKFRTQLVDKLNRMGYEVTFRFFDTPLDVLIERNNNRQGGIPTEKVIEYWHRMQLLVRPDVFQLRNKLNEFKTPAGKSKLIVPYYAVDLDGTFFDISGRKGYEEDKCEQDRLNLHVVAVVRGLLLQGYMINFFSGRRELARETTTKMIKEALDFEHMQEGVNWTLSMRANDDARRDSLVKIDMVKEFADRNMLPVAAIDDRKQVIEECWSLLDIPVLACGKPTERF